MNKEFEQGRGKWFRKKKRPGKGNAMWDKHEDSKGQGDVTKLAGK